MIGDTSRSATFVKPPPTPLVCVLGIVRLWIGSTKLSPTRGGGFFLTANVGPKRPRSASSKGLTKWLAHLPTDRRQPKFENSGLNPLEPLAELFSQCLISFYGQMPGGHSFSSLHASVHQKGE